MESISFTTAQNTATLTYSQKESKVDILGRYFCDAITSSFQKIDQEESGRYENYLTLTSILLLFLLYGFKFSKFQRVLPWDKLHADVSLFAGNAKRKLFGSLTSSSSILRGNCSHHSSISIRSDETMTLETPVLCRLSFYRGNLNLSIYLIPNFRVSLPDLHGITTCFEMNFSSSFIHIIIT